MCRFFLLTICSILTGNILLAQGVTDNANSPQVVFKSTGIGECQWTNGFWADKHKVCEEVMVPHMGTILKGDIGHALNNFKKAAGQMEGSHKGEFWHDGDFYKWMESVMYIYAENNDQKLLAELDTLIDIIGAAQEEDGYLSTQVTLTEKGRWENRKYHELYNSGHLINSACIHYRITEQENFLNIAVKHADYLYATFTPQPDSLKRFGFNQSQIMGLTELYRTTKDPRYLELAELFINMRGKSKPVVDAHTRPKMVGDMVQERTPLRKSKEAVGHAVLALYFYAGATDVYSETGEKALIDALDRLWEDVVDHKMYITGAVGQTHHGLSKKKDTVHEAFLPSYDMPNSTAYNETCANIANAMFSYRMLGVKGDAKYADVMELVLLNSAMSGISIEGKDYFYVNPLRRYAHTGDYKSTEAANREPYINCFCCPPNLVRTIAKSAGWAYSITNNGVAVNLYGGNKLETSLTDGSKLVLEQETNYPWEGSVTFSIQKCKKEAFDFRLRIPEWAKGTTVYINGKKQNEEVSEGTYAVINRKWKKGDKITLEMPMEIKLMEGHKQIEQTRNQVAVKRGPIVYCVETTDLPKGTDIMDVYLPENANYKAEYQSELLGGLSVIKADLMIRKDKKDTEMYTSLAKPKFEKYSTQLIPYYAWSNRGTVEMSVWLPVIWNNL
ncbi:glycoside hydrolase family 127 protein [Flammeovirga kamogawensis]|uniref:Glycoside hydrolase family 127 protein n=1 Tax=Flammeovirga kamogawensis TaxID=373891 RepID=A0ABX8H468_9BACT|nr:beta-L-arabinofuranosidase domain-containing protein [Flammeovirga kamogawensis]MBB6461949.1 hypothetical protein [Flammeovirga kamogawensis]QWG10444.1 glycoside hydrolase family 127 protein [Flammeovirga kamogawensis]TRX63954.1 glycoside hydrolase family 127 protein [Flammeovirga kamogawensis]